MELTFTVFSLCMLVALIAGMLLSRALSPVQELQEDVQRRLAENKELSNKWHDCNAHAVALGRKVTELNAALEYEINVSETLKTRAILLPVDGLADDYIDKICAPQRAARWNNDGAAYDRSTVRLFVRTVQMRTSRTVREMISDPTIMGGGRS